MQRKDEKGKFIPTLSDDGVVGKNRAVLLGKGMRFGCIWCLVLLIKGNRVFTHSQPKVAFPFIFGKPT